MQIPPRYVCAKCHKLGDRGRGFVHLYEDGQHLIFHAPCHWLRDLEEQVAMAKKVVRLS